MSAIIYIKAQDAPELLSEIEKSAKEAGLNPTAPARLRNSTLPVELIVALGSTGAFSALFKVISTLLLVNKDRELTIQTKKVTITLKGHSLPEEKELLKQLAPELMDQVPKKNRLAKK